MRRNRSGCCRSRISGKDTVGSALRCRTRLLIRENGAEYDSQVPPAYHRLCSSRHNMAFLGASTVGQLCSFQIKDFFNIIFIGTFATLVNRRFPTFLSQEYITSCASRYCESIWRRMAKTFTDMDGGFTGVDHGHRAQSLSPRPLCQSC